MKKKGLQGFSTHRFEDNPNEKVLHDTFVKSFTAEYLDKIVFDNRDTLSEREQRIVISTIQWLASAAGEGFLRELGYCDKEEFEVRERLFSTKLSQLECDFEKIPQWVKAIYL